MYRPNAELETVHGEKNCNGNSEQKPWETRSRRLAQVCGKYAWGSDPSLYRPEAIRTDVLALQITSVAKSCANSRAQDLPKSSRRCKMIDDLPLHQCDVFADWLGRTACELC